MVQKRKLKIKVVNKYSKYKKPFNKFRTFNKFCRFRRRLFRRVIKKAFVRKNLSTNFRLRKVTQLQRSKRINILIAIRILSNNIFCNIKSISRRLRVKTLLVLSAGILKLKVSRKMLRFTSKIFIEKVFKLIKRRIRRKTILLRMTGPIRIKKRMILWFVRRLKRKNKILLDVKEKKCFNGCLAKKGKRKKRRRFRHFKSK